MAELKHFSALNAVDVSSKIKTKKSGGSELNYLSWCWAWTEVKKKYPDAKYEILKFNDLPYVYDELTGYMVFTTVTIEGITHEMWLPVMDGSNKAMKSSKYTYKTKNGERTIEAATMFDINKTIMRCLTKNLAMFGLGLYIYADEDLPEAEQEMRKEAIKEAAELESKIKPIREEILKIAEEKIKNGVDKDLIYKTIADNNEGKKNPNAIKDVELAKNVLKIIKDMEATKHE